MLQNFLERVDNYLNPITVKELRQSVRNYWIVLLLNLFLGAQFLLVLVYCLDNDPKAISNGASLFSSLAMLLFGTTVVCIPFRTVSRLSAELREADMIFSTSLPPFQVILGKFLSGVLLSVLFFSASAPFLTLTYMMRGLDLQTIFLTLYFGFLIIQFLNCIAIFVGTLKLSPILQVVLAILLGFGLLGALDSFRSPFVFSSFYIETWEQAFLTIAISLGLYFVFGGLFLICAAVRITPEPSNRMTGMRIFLAVNILGIFILSWAYSLCACLIYRCTGREVSPKIIVCEVICLLLIALASQIAICERTEFSRRVVSMIPKRKILRLLAYPFFTGASPAIVWSFLMFGVVAANETARYFLLDNNSHNSLFSLDFFRVWGFVLFFVAYGTAAFFLKELYNWFQRNNIQQTVVSLHSPNEIIQISQPKLGGAVVWGIELILLFLGCAFPLILAITMIDMPLDYWPSDSIIYALNPFAYVDRPSLSSSIVGASTYDWIPFVLGIISLHFWLIAIGNDYLNYMKTPKRGEDKSQPGNR